jgi:uncharacterized protein (TIGR02757 family)
VCLVAMTGPGAFAPDNGWQSVPAPCRFVEARLSSAAPEIARREDPFLSLMRPHTPIRRAAVLKERLDELVATMDISTISPDPLELVLRYDAPADREIAGLIAAAFAYGRADIVVRNGGWILERMAPSPSEYLVHFSGREARERFAGFSHRFHKADDLVALLERLSRCLHAYSAPEGVSWGSLGEAFRSVHDGSDDDIGPSLSRFVSLILGGSRRKSLRYLLTSPQDGSACKRMNLFLRWMIRRESPDLGLWSFADPAKLVVPLDTHVHRISRFLGLSDRASADWKTARLVTDALKKFDAGDPVRYDFAICRLGILDLCSRERRKENCDRCLLRDVCRFPVG